jgi:hypothetical protein
MDAYFATRKTFIITALIAAELFVTVMHYPAMSAQLHSEPMVFWLFSMPLTLAILGGFAAMFLAGSRRANIAAIIIQIAIFFISYWSYRLISNAIRGAYGYAAP